MHANGSRSSGLLLYENQTCYSGFRVYFDMRNWLAFAIPGLDRNTIDMTFHAAFEGVYWPYRVPEALNPKP